MSLITAAVLQELMASPIFTALPCFTIKITQILIWQPLTLWVGIQCSLDRVGWRAAWLGAAAADAYTSTAASSTPTLNSGLFCQHCGAISMSLRGRTAAQQQCHFAMHTNKSPSTPACANLWKLCKYTSYQHPTATNRSPIDLIIFLRQLVSIMFTTLQIGFLSLMVTYSKIIIMDHGLMARSTLSHWFNRMALGNYHVLDLCPRRIW